MSVNTNISSNKGVVLKMSVKKEVGKIAIKLGFSLLYGTVRYELE